MKANWLRAGNPVSMRFGWTRLAVDAQTPGGQVLVDPLVGRTRPRWSRSRTVVGAGSSSVTASSSAAPPSGRPLAV